MNLHTLRLVTFSIIMEAGGGIGDKDPDSIWLTFNSVYSCTSLPELRALLPADLTHHLDNWLQVWARILAAQDEKGVVPCQAPPETAAPSTSEITTPQEGKDVPDHST